MKTTNKADTELYDPKSVSRAEIEALLNGDIDVDTLRKSKYDICGDES